MFKLETARLIIRKFQENDWQDLYQYLSDEDVVKYEPYNVYTQKDAIEEAKQRANDDNFYAVCLKDTNKLIGNLFFAPGHFDTWELGFVFNKNFQGCGYATESASALISYAFQNLNCRRIIAMCNPENINSWKLLERLKMRREGHLFQNIYFKKDQLGNPNWLDTYEYAILKSEW